jgi:hypothetical protein
MATASTAAIVRPAQMTMDQLLSRSVLQNINLTGKSQYTFRLVSGHLYRGLELQFDVTYDTTTGTLNPHKADLANIISRLQVKSGNGQVFVDLSGQDLYDMFLYRGGLAGDNVALVGASAQSGATARLTLFVPFVMEHSKQPYDGLLETITKDVDVQINWNDPTTQGVLFGTVTGLANVTATLQVSSEEYSTTPAVAKYLLNTTCQRVLIGADYPVGQTNNQFVIDKLPKNANYMNITLMPRSTANNNVNPDAGVLDFTKQMQVTSTANNTIYQQMVLRGVRGRTIQRRRNSNIADGLVDVPMTADGALSQFIYSTNAGELQMKVPAVAAGTAPTIRVVTETFVPNQG